MVNSNFNVNSALSNTRIGGARAAKVTEPKHGFSNVINAAGKYLSQVDDIQQSSNMAIKDLLSGKNEDITSVVSAVVKADMSFKLLVGVRNKLIEAYKQTMNMPL